VNETKIKEKKEALRRLLSVLINKIVEKYEGGERDGDSRKKSHSELGSVETSQDKVQMVRTVVGPISMGSGLERIDSTDPNRN
jgi:hypothetical protein